MGAQRQERKGRHRGLCSAARRQRLSLWFEGANGLPTAETGSQRNSRPAGTELPLGRRQLRPGGPHKVPLTQQPIFLCWPGGGAPSLRVDVTPAQRPFCPHSHPALSACALQTWLMLHPGTSFCRSEDRRDRRARAWSALGEAPRNHPTSPSSSSRVTPGNALPGRAPRSTVRGDAGGPFSAHPGAQGASGCPQGHLPRGSARSAGMRGDTVGTT